MVRVHRLVLPLGQAGLVCRTGHLVRIIVPQTGLVRALRGQHLVEQIQCGRRQGRKKGLHDGLLQARPINVQARGGPIARRERGTRVAALRLVGHVHLVAAAATDHKAREEGRAMAGCPPSALGKRACIVPETRLIGEKLLPTNVGGIGILMDGWPGPQRAPLLAGLAWPPLGVRPAPAIDKGPRVGGVVQDLRNRGVRRFAPEHLPRVQATVLAARHEHAVITQAAEHFLAAPEGRCRVSTYVSPMTDARTPWKHEVLAKPIWESGSAREVGSASVAKSAGCLCLRSALYSIPSPVRFKNKNVQFLQTKM